MSSSEEVPKLVPSTTADGSIIYEDYDALAKTVHQINAEKNGWATASLLSKGSYGYDNIVHAVASMVESKSTELHELAEIVHKSWIRNYLYWRDEKPFEKNLGYRKPYTPLGDERRNRCASLAYKDLPEDEQQKDLIIAEAYLSTLKYVLL